MRILSLPIALILAACLYLALPAAAQPVHAFVQALYARFLRLFTRKDGKSDDELAFPLFMLVFGGVCQLVGGLHILLTGLVTAPLFRAYAPIPEAFKVKDQLDSGVFSRNIGEYDARVRSTCAAFGPVFVTDMCAPLLLIALGTPIHMGCVLGGAYLCARALSDRHPAAHRTVALISRAAWQVMRVLWHLCAGLVGRSPGHAHGEDARTLLLSILGIAGDADDTHAPVSGDITQAVFLCLCTTALLTLMLCIALFSLC
ncbi:MAG: hypothetical protein IKB82_06635 [Clostridia bacterium]|nr:hypothetical protein [Clostridia bacterium]